MHPIFFGIVGQIASGKGEVVKILTEKYGFVSFNLSSILHKILEEKGIINFTRVDLQDLGDKLRKEEGEGVLAKRAIKYFCHSRVGGNLDWIPVFMGMTKKQTKMTKKVVIEGIRNPAEVKFLRTLPNFKLIAVKAKKAVRFRRLRKRGKSWDPKTWKDFLVVDRRDKGIGQKGYGQQVGKCVKMADEKIQNNGNLKKLESNINNLLSSLSL
ncbi:hypothetical protein AUK04_02630 [Candidatus Roizmanbacteria bacterium CG2_30_33_16]|uniref:Dephospho-CoA kinase n=2 Tax=Candidatus Roizmaniibacteriota TaxID=1752723 RepID=A0A2M8DBR5_9BACT|nr:MAG: hypothetical protein AUK04_02630 [Candidatus Roizmanbacteria bacterium CG2_30_33_16]PJB87843.1 MAG: hypothetical protein CO083_04870 [Candidatus Roizmanbacteria bacterium CG_4_9_14_0_8_um_filter_34_12]